MEQVVDLITYRGPTLFVEARFERASNGRVARVKVLGWLVSATVDGFLKVAEGLRMRNAGDPLAGVFFDFKGLKQFDRAVAEQVIKACTDFITIGMVDIKNIPPESLRGFGRTPTVA